MLDTYKELVVNQYEAALCTIHHCVDRCPDSLWQKPVVNNPFSQSVFHALFFADLYLGNNMEEQPQQAFHKAHTAQFGAYEQLEDREPVETYEKDFIRAYLEHCRSKAKSIVAAETREQLTTRAGFPWLDVPRAEVHLYNIRHLQHHAAQLILVLRKEAECNMGWVKSGWSSQ